MKIKELIRELEKINPEAEVLEYNEDDRAYFPAIEVIYLDDKNQYVSLTHNPHSMEMGYIFEKKGIDKYGY